MRKIDGRQIAVFAAYLTAIGALTAVTGWAAAHWLPAGDFRGVAVIGLVVVALYLYGFLIYRMFLRLTPLEEGELAPGSHGELVAQVNTLFYLVLFYSLTRTHFLPVPLLRLVHQALGARLGDNTYGGVILDPPLTTVGANCIIGHDAVLFAHAIEGPRFALSRIVIGDNVTIGAHAVIMSGVQIGHGAIVSAGAVVGKGVCIADGEVWGGIPARRLRAAGAGEAPDGAARVSPSAH